MKMKIILTGSLGHISKPLAVELIQQGHSVTVISSNPDKQKEIETLGAIVKSIEGFTGKVKISAIYFDVNFVNTL